MICSTATVPVNFEGVARLTRAQAWAGLELKARDARLIARKTGLTRAPSHVESCPDGKSQIEISR